MIANIDENVGYLMDRLESLGLEENTIVIFLSDNGPRTSRQKNDLYPDRYNAGLRGTKSSIYEGGIHRTFPHSLARADRGGYKTAAHSRSHRLVADSSRCLRRRMSTPTVSSMDGVSFLCSLAKASWIGRIACSFSSTTQIMSPLMYSHFAARTQLQAGAAVSQSTRHAARYRRV